MKRLTFEGNFCDISQCQENRGGIFCEYGTCSQRDVWERLKQYEDAEEQGLIVQLPCTVGSTIYVIPSTTNYGINKISYPQNNRVHVQTVEAILWCHNNRYLLRTCTGLYEALSDEFGVTWFLNPQDAEKALEELNNA